MLDMLDLTGLDQIAGAAMQVVEWWNDLPSFADSGAADWLTNVSASADGDGGGFWGGIGDWLGIGDGGSDAGGGAEQAGTGAGTSSATEASTKTGNELLEEAKNAKDTNGQTAFSGFLKGDSFRLLYNLAFASHGDAGIAGIFARLAQIVAGFLCLLHFANKAYHYMTGEEQWKIMPLLRPFGLLLVILSWSTYCRVCRWPAQYVCDQTYNQAEALMNNFSDKSEVRWQMIDSLTWRLYEKEKLTEGAEKSIESDSMMKALLGFMGLNDFTDLESMAIAGASWGVKSIMWFATFLIEKIGLLFLQFSVILVLLMQAIFCGILYSIGPLSFGFSVVGPWKNSWQAWTGRYISTCFFAPLLFVCIGVVWSLLLTCIEVEQTELYDLIAKTADPLDPWEDFYNYIGNMGTATVLYVACVMASAGATMYVPVAATWIIETGGVGNATTGIMSGVGAVTMGVTRVASYAGSMFQGSPQPGTGGQSTN